jgi:hypothetical protein
MFIQANGGSITYWVNINNIAFVEEAGSIAKIYFSAAVEPRSANRDHIASINVDIASWGVIKSKLPKIP